MWLVIWVVLAILIGYYYKEDEKKTQRVLAEEEGWLWPIF